MIKKTIKKIRNLKGKSVLKERLTDYADLFFNSNITFYPELLTTLKWNNILVLTPHADDETLGCGGLLLKAVSDNKNIKVILYSDNSESVNNIGTNEAIEMRSAEFREAMETIGIKNVLELKTTPNNFTVSQELIEITLKNILDYSPDLILLPSFIDNHEEHKILNEILTKALTEIKTETDIMMFEVWTAFSPNIILDITEVMNNKIKAICCYRSQLRSINYIKSITGLNSYRSITNRSGEGYSEGFVYLKSPHYIKFVRKYL